MINQQVAYGKWITVFILFLLVGSFVVSPQVASVFALNPDDLNCTATPDQILGQVNARGAGAVGEVADEGITPEGLDIEAEGLAVDAAWMVENLQYSSSGSQSVVVIAIDDFSSESDAEVVSHGWLVWEVLADILDALPDDVASHIILDQINIAGENGYRSDLVKTELETRLSDWAAQGVTRFVLNMSFVIIPCQDQTLNFNFFDLVEQREDDPGKSVVGTLTNDPAYLQSLLTNTSVEYIEDGRLQTHGGNPPAYIQEKLLVFRLFENRKLENDPLRQFLRQQTSYTIIPVAAAGNFKWKNPFFPARWGEVLSVSAMEGEDVARWSHSNNGDVSVPGAWYLFDDENYRAGTSLAAPAVSMMVAVDLTQDTPICGLRGSAPELTRGRYENRLLLDAVSRNC